MNRKKVTKTKGKDDWLTPQWLIDEISNNVNIDLDPCASIKTNIGDTNYRLEDNENGLDKEWYGVTFVNPPFSEKNKWVNKVLNERNNTDLIMLLTPDSTDVKSWWHNGVANADYVWFSNGRISYEGPNVIGRPTFGTSISLFGNVPEKLINYFKNKGWIVETVK